MKITKLHVNGKGISVVSSDNILIEDVQSALDVMATVRYETDNDRMVLPKALISESFFDLKTRLAGEILQKYINYQMKLAIVGDFSQYGSESLKDFIFECNKGNDIFFLPTEEQAVEKLSMAK